MQDNFSGNQSLRPTCWDILTFDKGKNNSPPIFCSKLPPHPFSPPGIPNNSRAKSHDLSWEHQHPSTWPQGCLGWTNANHMGNGWVGYRNSPPTFCIEISMHPWSFSHNSPLKRDLLKAPSKERLVMSSMHHCFQGIVHYCIPINKREWPWKRCVFFHFDLDEAQNDKIPTLSIFYTDSPVTEADSHEFTKPKVLAHFGGDFSPRELLIYCTRNGARIHIGSLGGDTPTSYQLIGSWLSNRNWMGNSIRVLSLPHF